MTGQFYIADDLDHEEMILLLVDAGISALEMLLAKWLAFYRSVGE